MLGTDLLVGGADTADTLATALCRQLDVERANVFHSRLLEWEQSGSALAAPDAYVSALGHDNTVLIHELPEPGDIGFIVEIDFLTEIHLICLKRLADDHGLHVGLSRDTVFPDEAGTVAGEGYVLFRPAMPPTAAVVLDQDGDGSGMVWGVLDQSLPSLPDVLAPKVS